METIDKIRAEIERIRKRLIESDAACFKEAYLIGGEDVLNWISSFLDTLQEPEESLRFFTEEQGNHIVELIGLEETYCHIPLDFNKETDIGYESYYDRIYIDGNITFDKMKEIVNYLKMCRIENAK